jgi:hypothetical protein
MFELTVDPPPPPSASLYRHIPAATIEKKTKRKVRKVYIPAVKAGEGGGWRIIPKEDDLVYMCGFYTCININIWWPMPLFLDVYLIHRYSTKVG